MFYTEYRYLVCYSFHLSKLYLLIIKFNCGNFCPNFFPHHLGEQSYSAASYCWDILFGINDIMSVCPLNQPNELQKICAVNGPLCQPANHPH